MRRVEPGGLFVLLSIGVAICLGGCQGGGEGTGGTQLPGGTGSVFGPGSTVVVPVTGSVVTDPSVEPGDGVPTVPVTLPVSPPGGLPQTGAGGGSNILDEVERAGGSPNAPPIGHTPEPSTAVLLLCGFPAAVGVWRRRWVADREAGAGR